MVGVIFGILTLKLRNNKVLDLPGIGLLTIQPKKPGRAIRFGKIARTGRKTKVHFKRKND